MPAKPQPPAPAGETVLCPRCGSGFQCGADSGAACWCAGVMLDERVRGDLATFYQGCLCRACLQTLEDSRPPTPSVWAILKKNLKRPR